MRLKLTLALIVFVVAGCDGRAMAASLSKPDRHEYKADGVVCYTYSTTISCVKVSP